MLDLLEFANKTRVHFRGLSTCGSPGLDVILCNHLKISTDGVHTKPIVTGSFFKVQSKVKLQSLPPNLPHAILASRGNQIVSPTGNSPSRGFTIDQSTLFQVLPSTETIHNISQSPLSSNQTKTVPATDKTGKALGFIWAQMPTCLRTIRFILSFQSIELHYIRPICSKAC